MNAYLAIAAQVTIAVVFAIAVAGKVRSRAGFDRFVTSIRMLPFVPPGRAATLLATLVVCAEIAVVAGLLIPATTPAGLALAAVLLLVFIGIAVRALNSGVLAECRCFGKRMVMGGSMVVRNLLLLAITLVAALPHLGVSHPYDAIGRPGWPVPFACAVVAGIGLAVVFTRYYNALAGALLRHALAKDAA